MLIKTARLNLRCWQAEDRDDFAALSADPEVMADLGGPIDRAASDRKFDRYAAAFEKRGYSRWLVEDAQGRFIGYTGVLPSSHDHPLGPHAEIGWRLERWAWGHGYAAEAARAALDDVFTRRLAGEVLAYTSAENRRSRAVMERLGLRRDASRDFVLNGVWHGLVWVADADRPWNFG